MGLDNNFLKIKEILAKKGELTDIDLEKIRAYLEAKIIICSCGTKYNVVLYNPGSKFFCYKCEKELMVPLSGAGEMSC